MRTCGTDAHICTSRALCVVSSLSLLVRSLVPRPLASKMASSLQLLDDLTAQVQKLTTAPAAGARAAKSLVPTETKDIRFWPSGNTPCAPSCSLAGRWSLTRCHCDCACAQCHPSRTHR